jgi:hypothetical protein
MEGQARRIFAMLTESGQIPRLSAIQSNILSAFLASPPCTSAITIEFHETISRIPLSHKMPGVPQAMHHTFHTTHLRTPQHRLKGLNEMTEVCHKL